VGPIHSIIFLLRQIRGT